MMKDYLIIAWITIVACWPITLPVLAAVAGIPRSRAGMAV